MPWHVARDAACPADKPWAVVMDSDGSNEGCHESEEAAQEQMAALYAHEPMMGKSRAVKFLAGSRTECEGMLAPYGGPAALGGKDLDGEYFSPSTDFALDWFGDWERPLLYQHGMDGAVKTSVVGRIKVMPTEAGLWMQAQLDAAHMYHEAIASLIDQGALGLSSGSLSHLVSVDGKSGEIKSWPLIEGSLTPTPANPDAGPVKHTVKMAEAVQHLAIVSPALVTEASTEVTTEVTVNVDPVKAVDVDALADIIGAVKSALTPQSLHDAAVASGAACATAPIEEPVPLLAVAGKSVEPVDLDAVRARLSATAIRTAQEMLR